MLISPGEKFEIDVNLVSGQHLGEFINDGTSFCFPLGRPRTTFHTHPLLLFSFKKNLGFSVNSSTWITKDSCKTSVLPLVFRGSVYFKWLATCMNAIAFLVLLYIRGKNVMKTNAHTFEK